MFFRPCFLIYLQGASFTGAGEGLKHRGTAWNEALFFSSVFLFPFLYLREWML
ncbi:hypothetical protein HMPREF3039_01704 [Akkermansia sp. KLE1798]|nr:hypothetical protein HMPREF3039_01704 [Akkermansia sp. KLE1798]KZA05523.1 hypothetical protein HMPREF1326_00698 [Akkermansia sp. KLE1605]